MKRVWDGSRIAERKKFLRDYVESTPCRNCGAAFEECGRLEFHHVEPEKKRLKISSMMLSSEKSFKSEMKKCILLCTSCHKRIHNGTDTDCKVCAICKVNKPKSEFWKNAWAPNGVQSYCKDCLKKYRKEKLNEQSYD